MLNVYILKREVMENVFETISYKVEPTARQSYILYIRCRSIDMCVCVPANATRHNNIVCFHKLIHYYTRAFNLNRPLEFLNDLSIVYSHNNIP